MTLDPQIMTAVEQLNYRVTVGDVAAQAGLDVTTAQRGLLALASEVSGNLQVSDTGDIAYVFPNNFRSILRDKFLRLRLQAFWGAIWQVLFYLIRISFGIFLLLSIVLIFATITLIIISMQSQQDNRNRSIRLPRLWYFTDLFWFFDFRPRRYRRSRARSERTTNEMNFLESIFSFLFGDGNPNVNLEERRWQTLGTVIRQQGGAVVAEQVMPYLDLPDPLPDDEYYMVPVLSRFDGQPAVSPTGEIVYHFPALQVTAEATTTTTIPKFLREFRWPFSRATDSQKRNAIGLGLINLVGAIVLGAMLAGGEAAAELGGLVLLVQSIFGVLLGYGIAFLAIPLGRYLWLKGHNRKLENRNQQRETFAIALQNASPQLQGKIRYAQEFAHQTVITTNNLAYTTEKDLLDQEIEQLNS